MQDALLNFCKWLENTSWALAISRSLWAYPVVQVIHFSGLSLWVGTIAVVDLRFLGLAGRRQSASELAEQLIPWTWTGLGIAFLGGALLFSASASAFFYNPAFRIKLALVLLGAVYHIIVQQKARRWGQAPAIPAVAKLATILELALWIGVITAAVEIPNH
ncbi:MAG TPA: DUF6644 family protein [Candidatus Acidoferrum sp.]|nr:DUF6644 family protein [Candidatus Acidoferrum sp.]